MNKKDTRRLGIQRNYGIFSTRIEQMRNDK